jgi:hypothetical protein
MIHQTRHRTTSKVLQPLLLLRGKHQATIIPLTTRVTHNIRHSSLRRALHRLYNQEVQDTRQASRTRLWPSIMQAPLARQLTIQRLSTQILWEGQAVRP